MLRQYGEIYVEWLKEMVEISDSIASGKLLRSIDYKIVKQSENYLLTITSERYLKYVDTGRRPGRMPPVDIIIKWAKLKGIKPNSGTSEKAYKQLGFAITTKIKKEGIKPKNLLFQTRQGLTNISEKAKNVRLSPEIKNEILNQLTNSLITESKGLVTIKKK